MHQPQVLRRHVAGDAAGLGELTHCVAATEEHLHDPEPMRVRQRHPGRAHFALALRSDGSPECDARKREFRESAARAGVPAFDELTNVADALSALADHERFVARLG